MAHSNDPLSPAATPAATRPDVPLHAGFMQSALTTLRKALSRDWVVEKIIDPSGDASLVVLAVDDNPRLPGFLLHQRNLIPYVATIADDAWQSDQAFGSWVDAAAAVVSMAQIAQPPSNAGTTQRTRGLRAA
jgi:hypothetical protein